MIEPKGQRLYVNLGSSQTKRRLKGFGLGVRQIQTAGNGWSVVVHTATAGHLEALMGKFADVGCAGSESDLAEVIRKKKNSLN
jgi:hypothetical protein